MEEELLDWLPAHPDFRTGLGHLKSDRRKLAKWLPDAATLARHNLGFIETNNLDRLVTARLASSAGGEGFGRVKLAILSSSTVDHLVPAIRVAGLRRGIVVDCYVAPYGQIEQEVLSADSGLRSFGPEIVLCCIDAHSAIEAMPFTCTAEAVRLRIATRVDGLREIWKRLQADFGAAIIQQTVMPALPAYFGHFEACVPGAPSTVGTSFNAALRDAARECACHILDLERLAMTHGAWRFIDQLRWYQGKQEIAPPMAPFYGEHVGRILQALKGLSSKCLILDLDNTLWGGVIGDDGVAGIFLGRGSVVGEAFLAFQHYVRRLKERGIVLAVCSKNSRDIVEAAFAGHPEMVLKLDDFAVLYVNWQDKATNIRGMTAELNLGLESMVFFDDNPVERALVRRELPMVAVPEVPQEPALFVQTLDNAGYFETVSLTGDDLQRAEGYAANRHRKTALERSTDLDGFLLGLEMHLKIRGFVDVDMPRIEQLINKTNQFNLTTRRYGREQLDKLRAAPENLAFTARLTDSFGDNGLIGILIAKSSQYNGMPAHLIDTWLMSCRVFGRGVEAAVLNRLAALSSSRGANYLIGQYLPTEKNRLVENHYRDLGFDHIENPAGQAEESFWLLSLDDFRNRKAHIAIEVEDDD